ncbi:MAG: choloylglycine hydrolase family protein [Gammaproteobacteria bacterium]|nr:choloylglycine hydrolase family protein [Gammaproteobacteria bacterium]
MKFILLFRSLFFLTAFLLSSVTFACTGIQLKAKDGSIINGRTVEFGLNLNLSGLVIPRNYRFQGTLPDGTPGLTYTSKYAVMGGGMFGEIAVSDGMNEKGLAMGDFYFPNYAGYAAVTADNKAKALSPTEFSNWVLTQFATVDEVKAGVKSVVIVGTTPKGWPVLPPFHYVVYDKSGKSVVIEPINGELKVYDNPVGVLTNSPSFDWHMTNLASYINLSPINAPPVKVDGMKLQQFGEGSGMHGLPGDFTPPSRFVRAAIFSSAAIPADNAEQAVFQAFHILNQFDIPFGSVRAVENKMMIPEYTLATIVRDPQNLKLYFRTFEDQTIKVIDLKSFDLDAKQVKKISMQGKQQVVDISKSATE